MHRVVTIGGIFMFMPGISISVVTSHFPSMRGACARTATEAASPAANRTVVRTLIWQSPWKFGRTMIARGESDDANSLLAVDRAGRGRLCGRDDAGVPG